MQHRPRRSPRTRLLLIVVALTVLLAGYYLGQFWQRRAFDDLSAVLYRDGDQVDYPATLALEPAVDAAVWRLFVVADTREPRCQRALRDFALMVNRLAAWPTIQPRLRVSLLAYDQPDLTSAERLRGGAPWLEILSASGPELDRLSGALGILPDPLRWCATDQLNGILVDPDRRRWALIPFEQPQKMAHNVQAVIQFVE